MVLKGWGMTLAVEMVSVVTRLLRLKSQLQPLDLCALVFSSVLLLLELR